MEQRASNVKAIDSGTNLASNNPYRQRAASHSKQDEQQLSEEKQTSEEQQKSMDSEKEVVSGEVQSGPSSAPMVVQLEEPSQPTPAPIQEAEKEVVDSRQTQSREESAPIPVNTQDPHSKEDERLNDIKGPPPDYDSIGRRSHSGSDDLTTPASIEPPTSLEPDAGSSFLAARPEDKSAVGHLLGWIPPAPLTSLEKKPRLVQPVVVPQLDVPPQGESVPFSRCYSDALASQGVSMREFTAFLDGLALAQAPNSALQGLNMFGVGVNSLPIPFIGLAGKGISALATSSSGHSGSRARMYIERAKQEYFAPRGLRMSIIKDNDLNPRLRIPPHASRLAPLTKSTLSENTCRRRMEGVAPYVAPLRFDVPEQDKQTQGVHKLARKHLESRFRDQNRKVTKRREIQWNDISFSNIDAGWDGRYAAKMSQLRKTQDELIRRQSSSKAADEKTPEVEELLNALYQDQRDLQILISEREMALQNLESSSKGVEAEMDEVTWSRRLKWIVIENLQ